MTIKNGTKKKFQKSIMEKGFYPDSLPTTFRVSNFHKFTEQEGYFDKYVSVAKKPTSLTRYSETKRGGQRRIFSVPNPIFFIDAARYFGYYRSDIDQLYTSEISMSVPSFVPESKRAIKIAAFSKFTAERRKKLAASRFIVKTDISRYFPSIYTHAIPWAVHGKSAAKKDRNSASDTIHANQLDFIVRQAQDQQTVGIPVGPDTSRIISEIIGSAIDRHFLTRAGSDSNAIRLVDDVYIGASTHDEAESLLTLYRDSIREFELDINENKTRVFSSKIDLEPFWPVGIRRELESFINDKGDFSKHDLTTYLDEIIRLTNQQDDDGIIKYSIRKIDELGLWGSYWDELEPFLIRVAINFSHGFDYVANVIVWRDMIWGVDKNLWSKVCNEVVKYHAPLGNDSEVMWACWLLNEIDGELEDSLAKTILQRCSPLCSLMTVHLAERSLITGSFSKKNVIQRIGSDPMVSSCWLLSYEAERLYGYRLREKNRASYPLFGEMIRFGVSFFEPDNPPSVFEEVEDVTEVSNALESDLSDYEDDL
ncbi:MAG: RNA-directed DNA polymerase [Pseudomonadota bacterium]